MSMPGADTALHAASARGVRSSTRAKKPTPVFDGLVANAKSAGKKNPRKAKTKAKKVPGTATNGVESQLNVGAAEPAKTRPAPRPQYKGAKGTAKVVSSAPVPATIESPSAVSGNVLENTSDESPHLDESTVANSEHEEAANARAALRAQLWPSGALVRARKDDNMLQDQAPTKKKAKATTADRTAAATLAPSTAVPALFAVQAANAQAAIQSKVSLPVATTSASIPAKPRSSVIVVAATSASVPAKPRSSVIVANTEGAPPDNGIAAGSVPRPKTESDLEISMGLENHKRYYNKIMTYVRKLLQSANVDPMPHYMYQPADVKFRISSMTKAWFPYLRRFKDNWPVDILLKKQFQTLRRNLGKLQKMQAMSVSDQGASGMLNPTALLELESRDFDD